MEFELVDNDTLDGTAVYLYGFLQILRSAQAEKVVKILLSNDGWCLTLMDDDIVSVEEQVHLGGDLEGGQVVDDELWGSIDVDKSQ